MNQNFTNQWYPICYKHFAIWNLSNSLHGTNMVESIPFSIDIKNFMKFMYNFELFLACIWICLVQAMIVMAMKTTMTKFATCTWAREIYNKACLNQSSNYYAYIYIYIYIWKLILNKVTKHTRQYLNIICL